MDDPNEENINEWVYINEVDMAEEATTLDQIDSSDISQADTVALPQNVESDIESDGISIISESSHLQESNTEDENFKDNISIGKPFDEPRNEEATDDNTATTSTSAPKPNWMFVDPEPLLPDTIALNQFYLNCLQEPIQELTEHELGTVQSDLESDGFSIISESEFLSNDQNVLSENFLHKNVVENRIEVSKQFSLKRYFNGVVIGTILIATTSVFLGYVFSSVEQLDEDVPLFKEEFNSDLNEESRANIKDKYDVQTALAYCRGQHKSDDIFMDHNIKKCLKTIENRIKRKKEMTDKKEEIKKLEKYLKSKEQFLDEKEKFLIKREYQLLKAETKLKLDDSTNVKNKNRHKEESRDLEAKKDQKSDSTLNSAENDNKKIPKFNSVSNDFKADKKSFKNRELKSHKRFKDKTKNYAEKFKYDDSILYSSEDKGDKKIEEIQKPEYKENKGFKLKHQKSNSPEYESYKIEKNSKLYSSDDKGAKKFEDIQKPEYKENKWFKSKQKEPEHESYKIEKNRTSVNQVKKSEKIKFKENKYSLKNVYPKKDKQFYEKHHRHQKEENEIGENTNQVILENNRDNLTISGYWVGKLYKWRSDLRNREHAGDWYFDRASYRKRKRDKAKWYFDLMNSRELFRHKRIY